MAGMWTSAVHALYEFGGYMRLWGTVCGRPSTTFLMSYF